MTSKQPLDLHAVVQAQLKQISFVKPLRLEDVAEDECSALDEGTSSSFSQGLRLNGTVAIFLDWWGWGRPHNRYSFTVFERINGRWLQNCARIEDIAFAVACAIHALAAQALGVDA